MNARDSESLETLLRKREPVWIKDPDDFPDLAQVRIEWCRLVRVRSLMFLLFFNEETYQNCRIRQKGNAR